LKNDADVMRIVQGLWTEYDTDANGVLDRREARRFVQDFIALIRIREGKVARTFKMESFEKWFTDVDKDANNALDMREMCNFIK
jgi:hypothetical protein